MSGRGTDRQRQREIETEIEKERGRKTDRQTVQTDRQKK